MRRERGNWVDVALAAVFTALGAAMTIGPEGAGGTIIDTLVIPTVTLPLIWRRRDPVAASLAVAAGLVLSGLPTFDQTRCGVAIPAALLIVFSVAVRRERTPALASLAAVLGGLVVLLLTDPLLGAGAAFVPPLAAGVWGAGRLVRARSELAGELAGRTRELERTREATAQLAVDVERARLAAELDIAARERIRSLVELASGGEQDGRPATVTFQRIETEGRAALNAVRELLGVLRSDGGDTSPRPTLAQLEALVAQARIGGGPVGLGVEGRTRTLPAGVELAAYRMVQHALEAFAADDSGPAGVTVRYLRASLELEVHGSLPRGDAGAALAAARERVTAHGGAFSALAQGSGRLLVRAQLPLATSGA